MEDFERKRKGVDFAEIRSVDMVSYLEGMGIEPVKIRGVNYWYLSPLRNERTASFKINRCLNRWYDHGTGQGGNLIDFLVLYHQCQVKEVIAMFTGQNILLHQPVSERKIRHSHTSESIVKIIKTESINSAHLQVYLAKRKIALEVANQFCK